MKVEILKPIVGTGDAVEGYRHRFALDPGDQVNVEDKQAVAWIEGGIARAVPAGTPRETAKLQQPGGKGARKRTEGQRGV